MYSASLIWDLQDSADADLAAILHGAPAAEDQECLPKGDHDGAPALGIVRRKRRQVEGVLFPSDRWGIE